MGFCCLMFSIGALVAGSVMGFSWFIAGRTDGWSRLGIGAGAAAGLLHDGFDGRSLNRNSGEYSRSTEWQ